MASSSNPPGQSRPNLPYCPPILHSPSVSKIPVSTQEALNNLQAQVAHLKTFKAYNEFESKIDYGKVEVELSVWRNETSCTASTLHKQLALEIFSNALIHCYNDNNLCNVVTPPVIQAYQLFSNLMSHPSFQQYLPYLRNESTKNVLKICFTSAVNAIRKFERYNESALNIVDSLEKEIQQLTEQKEQESVKLLATFERENDKDGQKQTPGKKDLHWCLATPFHKNCVGNTAEKWQPLRLPFTFQQIRLSTWRHYELGNLKSAILQTVIQTKVAAIKNRYNQLLMRIYYDTQIGRSDDLQLLGKSKYRFNETANYGRTRSYPIVANLDDDNNFPNGTKVRLCPDAFTLYRWREQRIEQASNITLDDIVEDTNIEINWTTVAGKMGKLTNFILRSPDECKTTWYNVVVPTLKNQEWTLDQIKLLKNAVNQYGERNWDKVAQVLGLGYTSFQCFYTYERLRDAEANSSKNSEVKQKDMEVGVAGFSKIVELTRKLDSHVTRTKYCRVACEVAEVVSNLPNISFQQLAENYNRFSRPGLVKGDFNIVEDMLLVVCMVKMREFLKEARTFAPLKNYLPWRFINNWTTRADSIFRPWRAIWTREQDLQLMEIVHRLESTEQKLDWKAIASNFDVSKNRKNARGRYQFLTTKLETLSFDDLRAEYEANARCAVSTQRLESIIKHLKEVLISPKTDVPAPQLLQDPTDDDLRTYLSSFDKELLKQTISDLEIHLKSQNTTIEEECPEPATKKCKSIDRRKFVRGDPASTASVIHLRKLTLVPLEIVSPVNDFEASVYYHFDIFKFRPVKSATVHKFIPTAYTLATMPEIRRILDLSTWQSEVDVEIKPEDDIFLDDRGYPILTDLSSSLQNLVPKRKTKYELRKDRRARMQKQNQQRITNKTPLNLE